MRQGELNSTELKFTHPICPACDVPMWLTHFEPEPTKPGHAKCTFECKACGGSVTEVGAIEERHAVTRQLFHEIRVPAPQGRRDNG